MEGSTRQLPALVKCCHGEAPPWDPLRIHTLQRHGATNGPDFSRRAQEGSASPRVAHGAKMTWAHWALGVFSLAWPLLLQGRSGRTRSDRSQGVTNQGNDSDPNDSWFSCSTCSDSIVSKMLYIFMV